jgi:hypothetical protein
MLDAEARPRGSDVVDHRLAALMIVVASTLGLMCTLHLSGVLAGGSAPFNASHAGVAEAIIAVVLFAGADAVLANRARAQATALAATVFAIVGFIVGLTFTVRGGDAIDIAYHVVVLPILVLTALGLAVRPGRRNGRRHTIPIAMVEHKGDRRITASHPGNA